MSPQPATAAWDRRLYRVAAAAALLLIGLMSFFPVQSDDIFMYLAIGRRFFREGGFPRTDPFLFSIPNYAWHILHEWASHLLAFGLFVLGGWNGLIVAKTVGIVMIAAVPLRVAQRLGRRSAVVPLLIVLAGFAGNHRFIERSSLVSDFFTAAVVAILLCERVRPGRGKYALPLIFLAWINLHPGFYTGLGLCVLAVLVGARRWRATEWRRLTVCVAASALCCLANPRGLEGVLYPLRPLFDPSWQAYRQFNYEWMPTLAAGSAGATDVTAFLLLAATCAALWLRVARQRAWFEGLVLLLLVAQGLMAVRFLTTASFSLAVLGAALAARAGDARILPADVHTTLRRIVCAGVAIAALADSVKIAAIGYGPPGHLRRPGFGLDPRQHPEAAAAFIERIGLSTPLFNQHEFGSYLAWRWDGSRKLYYHGFVDDLAFYRREYMAVNDAPEDFDRIVAQHRLGAFLLTRLSLDPQSAPPLYRLLLTRPDWRLVYADDRALLFLRDVPENREALSRAAANGPA